MNRDSIIQHNRKSWDEQSRQGSRWSTPVSPEVITSARAGEFAQQLFLTPNKHIPTDWFSNGLESLTGKHVLCLASGGGQQAPILAAAGAIVTSFDNSEEQLAKDRLVAEREGIEVQTLQGDMADLSMFAEDRFDLIVHAVSNVFVPDVQPVWNECYRVLRKEGLLMSGFMNPSFFLFHHEEAEEYGILQVKYSLPYSDIEQRPELLSDGSSDPFEFGHSLEQQIGGQMKAGFLLKGLYDDDWSDNATPLNAYSPTSIATLSVKL